MKHFKNPATNQVYAYESDGSQDGYIEPGLVPISDAELAELRAPSVDPSEAIIRSVAELEASITPRRLREALLSGDMSFIESVEQGIAALRAQLSR